MGTEVDWKFHSVPPVSNWASSNIISWISSICITLGSHISRAVWYLGFNSRSVKEPQGKLLAGSLISRYRCMCQVWKQGIGLDQHHDKKSYKLLRPTDQETLDHLGIVWINEEYRGASGPIKVYFQGVIQNPFCKAWIDTFKCLDKVNTGGMWLSSFINRYSPPFEHLFNQNLKKRRYS